jgi:hypothetical protein
VQAGELQAEHHRRPLTGGDEVGSGAQARQRGVAAHVPDVQALHPVGHPQVAGQQDVEPRRDVARAGHDGEQPDVPGVQAGVGQRAAHRALAQRQRLGQEALHPGGGAPPEMSSSAGFTTPRRVSMAECRHTLRASRASA